MIIGIDLINEIELTMDCVRKKILFANRNHFKYIKLPEI